MRLIKNKNGKFELKENSYEDALKVFRDQLRKEADEIIKNFKNEIKKFDKYIEKQIKKAEKINPDKKIEFPEFKIISSKCWDKIMTDYWNG